MRSLLFEHQRDRVRIVGSARERMRHELRELCDWDLAQQRKHLCPALCCGSRLTLAIPIEESSQDVRDSTIAENEGVFRCSMFVSQEFDVMPRIKETVAFSFAPLVFRNDLGIDHDAQPLLVDFDDGVAMSPACRNRIPVALETDLEKLVDRRVFG